MEERRFCRKCLLKDFDEEKYLSEIKKELDWMDAEMKASDNEYDKRLSICSGCDKLNAGTCLSCGCYVELRAAMKTAGCPKKKW